ncbi:MAG: DNA-3-methyladenine glycosylase I [Demequina sp.]
MITDTNDLVRCFGGDDPLYTAYHDHEWGHPVRGDNAIYERIVLEGFQSGLSWLTILRKRENFRAAFAGFDADAVAQFTDDDVERLLADEGIVRNRLKIESALTNARATVALQADGGSLTDLVWSHAPDVPRTSPPTTWQDVPASTEESKALAKDLKSHGFVFVGPTTMYALMQACGLVNDHIDGCIALAENDERQ